MLEPIDDDSTEIQLMVLQLSPWSKVHIFAAQISLEINLVSKKWAKKKDFLLMGVVSWL